ncbi:MAG: UDP-N-acetylmuramoyl-tripeptide--D-alanyl-D-alanine ligase [Tumebacillaceae bacterium]
MIKRTTAELARMTGGRIVQGSGEILVEGVATDTRQPMHGKLFIPIVGEKFDAHDFIAGAAEQGAAVSFWQADRPRPEGLDLVLIEVDDTLKALQRLAASYREDLGIPIVAVTGSNGKTSTKDLIAAVLSQRFNVVKTLGNLNTQIGLPLMLLSLATDTEVAVLEMGMDRRGQIAVLASIAKPQFGVITNIGESHIEFLGSRGGIADAKCELIEGLAEGTTAFLMGDEPLLRERADRTQADVVWFGFGDDNDLQAVDVENLGTEGSRFTVRGTDLHLYLPVPGRHQVGNALAAIGIARAMGLTAEEIAHGLEKAKETMTKRRFEVHRSKFGGTLIDDAYNANPTAMRPALQMLAEMPGGFKIAALGGMLELGPDSPQMHRDLGAYIAGLNIDLLVTIGDLPRDISAGAREQGFPTEKIVEAADRPQAITFLETLLKQHANDPQEPVLLIKGSLGTKLVEVVQALI